MLQVFGPQRPEGCCCDHGSGGRQREPYFVHQRSTTYHIHFGLVNGSGIYGSDVCGIWPSVLAVASGAWVAIGPCGQCVAPPGAGPAGWGAGERAPVWTQGYSARQETAACQHIGPRAPGREWAWAHAGFPRQDGRPTTRGR